MPVQMRVSASDERWYSPDRDIAYAAPYLIKRALAGLNYDKQEPWIKNFLETNNVKPEDLMEVAKALASYFHTSMFEPTNKTPFEALEQSGFFKTSEPAQIALCAKLGQVFLSSVFVCMRDVTRVPSQPPFDKTMLEDTLNSMQEKILATKSNGKA